MCALAHEMLRERELHSFPFDAERISRNGIYVLFEKGEEGHGGPRIVRVGTHTGANQLRSRLVQHFLKENKDRSIFRKNIGRCLLTRSNDGYLPIWQQDFTARAARLARPAEFDAVRQAAIESDVSRYIRDAFSFVTIEVAEKDDRLRLEAGLVSLVSHCSECGPSGSWLGLHSPKDRIRESGLWQVNELYKTPIMEPELRTLLAPVARRSSGWRGGEHGT